MQLSKIILHQFNYQLLAQKPMGFVRRVAAKLVDSSNDAKNLLNHKEQKLLSKLAPQYDYAKKKPLQWAIKRSMDYIGGSTLLVVSSPIIGFSALAVKLETKGPAFFIQKRVGKMGKEIFVIKLRTMVHNLSEQSLINGVNDSRITKVGRVLRKFSLDEFPQLINILKGDMTFIGPRASQYSTFKLLAAENPESVRRFAMLPGAKIKYSGIKNYDNKVIVEIEKEYLDNWGLKNDAKNLYEVTKDVICGKNG